MTIETHSGKKYVLYSLILWPFKQTDPCNLRSSESDLRPIISETWGYNLNYKVFMQVGSELQDSLKDHLYYFSDALILDMSFTGRTANV